MSDMRDDLDELGRRLWPTTDALRPAQSAAGAGGRGIGTRLHHFELLVTLAAAVLLIGVIGGAVALGRSLSGHTPTPIPATSSSPSPAPSASASPATPSPSPSPTPALVQQIVWTIDTTPGMTVRIGTATGGFRTVAHIDGNPSPLALGAGVGHLLYMLESTHHLYALDLTTGAVIDEGGGGSDEFYGGAFFVDGTRVAYIRQTGPGAEQLRVLDFRTGTNTTVKTYSTSQVDIPQVWTDTGIAALRTTVPYTDGRPSGMAILDPATGAEIAATNSNSSTWVVASDGRHAAQTVGTANDSIAAATIGTAPRTVRTATQHYLQPIGVSPEGSIVYTDWPGAGGNFAGITLSPYFGLFTISNGQATQVSKYSPADSYGPAAFIDATHFVTALAKASSATSAPSSVLLIGGPGGLTGLDNFDGNATGVFVLDPLVAITNPTP